ncbi:MAG: hypothetical protein HY287_12480 [Planctomycetes bacterium]|nr:hypothetical protein [Planctomycetota bacterium]
MSVHRHRILFRKSTVISIGVVLLAFSTGCIQSLWSQPKAVFDVTDYSDPAQERHYSDTFTECYYDLDPYGNVSLVFRRGGHSDNTPISAAESMQVVYVRGVWHSVAGKNPFHETQINGTVTYAVTGKGVGTSMEGAGAVHFDTEYLHRDRLTGTLEHALVLPKRNLSTGSPPIARAEISGEFEAVRDPRRVARISHDVDRFFGPRTVDSGKSQSNEVQPPDRSK